MFLYKKHQITNQTHFFIVYSNNQHEVNLSINYQILVTHSLHSIVQKNN